MKKNKFSIDSKEFKELISGMLLSKKESESIYGGAEPSCNLGVCTNCIALCKDVCTLCKDGMMR